MGGIKTLQLRSVFHGKVAVPPIIARLNIAAAGAIDVNKLAWTIFDAFLKAFEDKLLNIALKESIQEPFEFFSPSFFSLSMMTGVLMSK